MNLKFSTIFRYCIDISEILTVVSGSQFWTVQYERNTLNLKALTIIIYCLQK